MSPIAKISFKEWQTKQSQNPEFVTESLPLEVGYQIARLRMQRGLTQSQLAQKARTGQSSIARLENGDSDSTIAYLQRIAAALDAHIRRAGNSPQPRQPGSRLPNGRRSADSCRRDACAAGHPAQGLRRRSSRKAAQSRRPAGHSGRGL